MPLHDLTFKNLAHLDEGILVEAFEQEKHRIIADLRDRPGNGQARELNLKVKFVPVCDEAGNLTRAKVTCGVHATLPKRQTRAYDMAATRQGLHFSEYSPDDVRQLSIHDEAGPRPDEIPTETPDTDQEEAHRAS